MGEFGVWEMTFLIAGPIFVMCVCVVLVFFFLWQRKQATTGKHFQHQSDPLLKHTLINFGESDPSGPSLRDLIDMTTSGSGSGNQHACDSDGRMRISWSDTNDDLLTGLPLLVQRSIARQVHLIEEVGK